MPVNSKQIEWRDVVGFPSYEVSNDGKVRGKRYGIVRKLHDNGYGYYVVSLWKGNTTKRKKVHRLVAEAFIPRESESLVVNHKNGNKHDNRVENLEWITQKENLRHAFVTGLKPITETQREACRKTMKKVGVNHVRRVVSTDADGAETLYDSVKEAADAFGITKSAITLCCRGKNKTCRGMEWRYADAVRQPRKRQTV